MNWVLKGLAHQRDDDIQEEKKCSEPTHNIRKVLRTPQLSVLAELPPPRPEIDRQIQKQSLWPSRIKLGQRRMLKDANKRSCSSLFGDFAKAIFPGSHCCLLDH